MNRIFSHAFQRLFRSPGIALPTAAVLALLVFFVNVLLAANWLVGGFVSSVVERLPLTVYLRPEASSDGAKIVKLVTALQNSNPGVKAVYVSPKDALRRQAERFPDLVAILEAGDENPLPGSVVVTVPDLGSYDGVDAVIRAHADLALPGAEKTLADYRMQSAKIRQAASALGMARAGIVSLAVLFALAAAVILYAAIGNSVFFWQDEIRVARLVGAGPAFIHGPFAAQGGILAAAGALAGIAAFRATAFVMRDLPAFGFTVSAGGVSYSVADYPAANFWWTLLQALAFVALGAGAAYGASLLFSRRAS